MAKKKKRKPGKPGRGRPIADVVGSGDALTMGLNVRVSPNLKRKLRLHCVKHEVLIQDFINTTLTKALR